MTYIPGKPDVQMADENDNEDWGDELTAENTVLFLNKPQVKANYGTPEGLKKAWDTRGRGQTFDESGKLDKRYAEGTERYRQALAKFPPVPGREHSATSRERYMNEDGTFTPERQKLHKQIEDEFLRMATRVDNPVSYMLGGGPASGKSTIMKTLTTLPQNMIVIDADKIKAMLPDFHVHARTPDKDGVGPSPKTAEHGAGFTHAESSMLATNIIRRAAAEGKNVLLDGTGDKDIEDLARRVKELRGEGRPVHAVYATTTVEAAISRNQKRYDEMVAKGITPRKVPEAVLRSTHASVSRIFAEAVARGLYDKVSLYDTEERSNPRLIATGAIGKPGEVGVVTVIDKDRYDKFEAKRHA